LALRWESQCFFFSIFSPISHAKFGYKRKLNAQTFRYFSIFGYLLKPEREPLARPQKKGVNFFWVWNFHHFFIKKQIA
jgi:hypothetical protein